MATNNENVKLSQDYYLSLLSKVLENKKEEREMSLDRYRRADEQMDSAEQFAIMGKNAVSFLKLASDSTNDIAKVAAEIKSIIFKEDSKAPGESSMSDADKRQIIDEVKQMKTKKIDIGNNTPDADSSDTITDLTS
jgi:hypothetical protein